MELYVLEDQTGPRHWWTGATDIGNEGNWFWVSSKETMADFVWHDSQPNDGYNGNCMELCPNQGVDVSCAEKFYPICQRITI